MAPSPPPALGAESSSTLPVAAARHAPAPPLPVPRDALLRHALALGLLGEVLLRGAPGSSVTLWTLALLASAAWLARGGGQPLAPGALAWVALPALALALRDAPALRLLLLLVAAGGWIRLVAMRRGRRGAPPRPGRVAGAIVACVGGALLGGARLVEAFGRAPPSGLRRLRPALAGAVLAAPLLAVFTALFRSADPLFDAQVVRALEAVRGIEPLRTATALALAWLAAGLLREALLRRELLRLPVPVLRPSPADPVLVALLLVNLLFGAFALTQLGAWFGGASWIASRAGLSLAEYARRGFFELVAVAALALPLLLAADHALLRAPRRQRRALRVLGRVLLGLLAVVLVSAAYRMALYVEAYGLTLLRAYTSAAMLWLAVAGAAVGARLAGRRRPLLPALAVVAAAEVGGLALVSPDAVVAHVNLARHLEPSAAERPPLDVGYLGSLSDDATPALLAGVVRLEGPGRCALAAALAQRARRTEEEGWRTWSVARWRAEALLAREGRALARSLAACPRGAAAPAGAWRTPPPTLEAAGVP